MIEAIRKIHSKKYGCGVAELNICDATLILNLVFFSARHSGRRARRDGDRRVRSLHGHRAARSRDRNSRRACARLRCAHLQRVFPAQS